LWGVRFEAALVFALLNVDLDHVEIDGEFEFVCLGGDGLARCFGGVHRYG
jgi:hypothetical protein